MTTSNPTTQPATAPDQHFLADVRDGLSRRPRMIPPKYFYDARGSALFDRICELPEYYLTRTEIDIMREHAGDMAEAIGSDVLLIEPGSGSSIKVRLLLSALDDPAGYVPVEICAEHLAQSAAELAADHPGLDVLPVCADFTVPFAIPRTQRPARRRLVYFPGSTLGNFPPEEAVSLLRNLHRLAGDGGLLLLGIDLHKSSDRLIPAYDDSAGVTAAFNRNLLWRINRELQSNFHPDQFSHRVVWNAPHSRIEMHLVSERDQSARIGDTVFDFPAGEHIVTEYSYKYTREALHALAAQAGFAPGEAWQDAQGLFSVELLRRA